MSPHPTAPPDEAPAAPVPHQRLAPPGAQPAKTDDSAGEADRSGPRMIVIVGLVLVGATALVLVTIGAVFGLSRLSQSGEAPAYTVGDCVVQEGDAAEPAACSEPGAYQIVSQVDSRDECGDPTQPAVEVTSSPPRFYCLVPVTNAGDPADDTDSGDSDGDGDGDGDSDGDGDGDGAEDGTDGADGGEEEAGD